MTLTPEERQRIYEEEKTRLEVRREFEPRQSGINFLYSLAITGAVILIGGLVSASSAPQQAAVAGIAIAFAVLPYCLARAAQGMSSRGPAVLRTTQETGGLELRQEPESLSRSTQVETPEIVDSHEEKARREIRKRRNSILLFGIVVVLIVDSTLLSCDGNIVIRANFMQG